MKRVRILTDTNPIDPREHGAGRMVCWHRRYNLGDDHKYDCEGFLRELAFEADPDTEERVWRLECEVWNRLYDYTDSFDRTNELISAKVNGLIESAISDNYLILPLYLMDHSGISMSVRQFSCGWDSGQVGYIVCDNETIEREFNGDSGLAEKCLRSEVAVYDDYLTGNVYGFIVEEDGEEIDSCWGFYGSDVRTNGMSDHLDDDLVDIAADAEIEYQ
jgi:hypothetical protein